MMDKFSNIFLLILLTAGGMVILVVTWVQPMALSERIIPSFVGAAGIVGVLVWTFILRSKSAKVRVTGMPDKSDVKKEVF